MDTVTRSKLFSKPEVQELIETTSQRLRALLIGGSFGEFEEAALAITGEVSRVALEGKLQALADELGEVVLVNGREYKQHEPGSPVVHSLCGPLHVTRYTYREVGVHNGPTVVPMALLAGLIEGATPALAFNVAHGYGQHDMRTHLEVLENAHRVPPPRATLERLAKRLAVAACEAPPRIEAAVRRTEKLPDGARAVSFGIDRTAVPMAESVPEGTPPKPTPKRRKLRVRRAPAPIVVNYRMAYVATVSVVDENGEALVTRRHALPACDDAKVLVGAAIRDIETLLCRDPQLAVGIVQDGAPEMWNLARAGLAELVERGVVTGWEEGIDRFHLLERLGSALELIEPDAHERKRRLHRWNELLDARDSAIDTIERELVLAYEKLPAATQEQLRQHLIYIDNNKDRMRYVSLTVAGLPIGSGATESAAKTVVGQRTKNSGQRWSEAGLRGVLKLRALAQSERLPPFWSGLSRTYTANVVNREAA